MEDLLKKIEERIDNKQILANKNKWTYKLKYKFYDILVDHTHLIMISILCLFMSLMFGIACYFMLIDMIILVPITCIIVMPLGCVLLCLLMSKLIDLARQSKLITDLKAKKKQSNRNIVLNVLDDIGHIETASDKKFEFEC